MKYYFSFCIALFIFLAPATQVAAMVYQPQFPHSFQLQPPPPNIGKSLVPNTQQSDDGMSPTYDMPRSQNPDIYGTNNSGNPKNSAVDGWLLTGLLLIAFISSLVWLRIRKKS